MLSRSIDEQRTATVLLHRSSEAWFLLMTVSIVVRDSRGNGWEGNNLIRLP